MKRRPSKYFGDQGSPPVGRTRLFGEGGQPIPPAEGVDAASGHDGRSGEDSGGTTPPEPATRQLRARQQVGDWDENGVHIGCGGQKRVNRQTGRRWCDRCQREQYRNRAGEWEWI